MSYEDDDAFIELVNSSLAEPGMTYVSESDYDRLFEQATDLLERLSLSPIAQVPELVVAALESWPEVAGRVMTTYVAGRYSEWLITRAHPATVVGNAQKLGALIIAARTFLDPLRKDL